MKTQKICNVEYVEKAIDSAIEDSVGFLADDIASILVSIELDSKINGIALDEVIRSNSVLSSKLDSVLFELCTSLSREIKDIFGIKAAKTILIKK